MIASNITTPFADSGEPPSRENPRSNRLRAILLGVFGGAIVVPLAIAAFVLFTRERAPLVTADNLHAAQQKWNEHGPADYELDLELTGNRPGKVHVEVRDRQVVHMTRDGVEPKQKRTWDYWSVRGMFDTIADELEMAKAPAKAFNAPAASQVMQRADFDPSLGYPRRYDRVVLGADFEVHWRVTRFEDLSKKHANSKEAAR